MQWYCKSTRKFGRWWAFWNLVVMGRSLRFSVWTTDDNTTVYIDEATTKLELTMDKTMAREKKEVKKDAKRCL